MAQMGILRRIDELGRIVIPKGIRNRMRINEGDTLELVVTENNEIKITKFDSFQGNSETIFNLLSALSKEMGLSLALCSSQEFIMEYPVQEPSLIHRQVNNALIKAINERKVVTLLSQNVFENEKEVKYLIVYPLAKYSEALGALIVINRESLSEEENKLISLFRNIIVNLLKE